MAKFSISKLEAARSDPKKFALDLKNEAAGGFPMKSMFLDWQRAVNNFHISQHENDAIKYLTTAFKNHFTDTQTNSRKLEEHIIKLQNYIKDVEKKKLFFNEKSKRIAINLSPALSMTGQIPLIYLNNSTGYVVAFFQKMQNDWMNELKFPIIQNYVAKFLYGCGIAEVEVGVFSFEDEEHRLRTYTQKEINTALSELTKIGNTISSYL